MSWSDSSMEPWAWDSKAVKESLLLGVQQGLEGDWRSVKTSKQGGCTVRARDMQGLWCCLVTGVGWDVDAMDGPLVPSAFDRRSLALS